MNQQTLSKKETIQKVLAHPWCFRIVRWLMAALFIYASIDKILHPAGFAESIYHYQVLPNIFIPPAALILPLVELLVGLLLITGFWLPGAIGLLNLMLLTFFSALLFNTIRGLNVDCGCFVSGGGLVSRTTMLLYLMRDGFFLLVGFYLAGRVLNRERKE